MLILIPSNQVSLLFGTPFFPGVRFYLLILKSQNYLPRECMNELMVSGPGEQMLESLT